MEYHHRTISVAVLAAAMMAVIPLASGCGGGATQDAVVVLKPSRPDAAVAEVNGEAPARPDETGPAATGFGTFRGRVVLEGAAPPISPEFVVRQGDTQVKDHEICARQGIPNESLHVGPDGGVANVFVYLDRSPSGAKETAAHEADWPTIFDQVGCRYVPHAMVARVGQAVTVSSQDPILHNVKTAPQRNNPFNVSMSRGDERELVYTRPETAPVRVSCDIHPWMTGYHLPVDHPYAAVTDENGQFVMTDLPVGRHEFRVWHERRGLLQRYTVEITADGDEVERTISFGGSLFAGQGPRPETKTVLLPAALGY